MCVASFCNTFLFDEYNLIMKKIAVVGHKGRMGSLIVEELRKDYIVDGVGRNDNLDNLKDIDLVIDFSNHKRSLEVAEFCLKNKLPIIIGSTGHTGEENERLEEISKHIRLIKKANFSRGIKVLENFVECVLRLAPQKFEIIEKHHKNKLDSPSGTALELERFIRQRFSGVVDIKSIREGDEMGEHTIVAYVGDEKLTITHNVYSRDVFVKGVACDVKLI